MILCLVGSEMCIRDRRKTILKTTHSGLKTGVVHGKAFISGLTGKQDGKCARKNSGPKKRSGL